MNGRGGTTLLIIGTLITILSPPGSAPASPKNTLNRLLKSIDQLNKRIVQIKEEVRLVEKHIEELKQQEKRARERLEQVKQAHKQLKNAAEVYIPLLISGSQRLNFLRAAAFTGVMDINEARIKVKILSSLHALAAEKLSRLKQEAERVARASRRLKNLQARALKRKEKLLRLLENLEELKKEKRAEARRIRAYELAKHTDAYVHTQKIPLIRKKSPISKSKGSVWHSPVEGGISRVERKGRGLIFYSLKNGARALSSAPGEVAFTGWLRGLGNVVIVLGKDGYNYIYAHLDEVNVDTGTKVEPGDVIGRIGATGIIAEDALYFEVRRGETPLPVEEVLRHLNQTR